MKRYLVVIVLAIISGGLLAMVTFKGLAADAKELNRAYLIQLGVFKSKDNAEKKANPGNYIIIKEGDFYHVYSHIFTNLELVKKVTDYYDEKKIRYYVKNVDVNNELINKINEYENILKNVNDISIINKTSEKVLKLYQEYEDNNEE